MQVDEIVREALRLPPEQRHEVVDMLTHSLEVPDAEIDRLWIEECVGRLEAYRRGEVKGVPMEEVFSRKR